VIWLGLGLGLGLVLGLGLRINITTPELHIHILRLGQTFYWKIYKILETSSSSGTKLI
jgi:hypothetical protein